jgi:hypothetical protein
MKNLLMVSFLISLTGCASAIPGSEDVLITKNVKDVKGCKLVGTTYSSKTGIRNVTLLNGGDTALLTSSWLTGTMDGGGSVVMYNCHGTDTRQPVPVTPVK